MLRDEVGHGVIDSNPMKITEKGSKEHCLFLLGSNDFGFICADVSNVGVIKETPDIIGVREPVWASGKALGW